MRIVTSVGAAVLGLMAMAAPALADKADKGPVPATADLAVPAMPAGVTLQAGRAGAYYADAKGMTLYTFDMDKEPGKSACAGECIAAWPALAAPADAQPFGAWSVVTREDGSKQWALRGKPLYTFVKDQKVGDTTGVNVANVWRLAAYVPGAGLPKPDGIDVQVVPAANGPALVDAQGRTLYVPSGAPAAKGNGKESAAPKFAPVAAPQLANAVGDFTTVAAPDGTKQWAFKGKPLFTFAGDKAAGDANGADADRQYQVAVLEQYFMPKGVVVRHDPEYGVLFTNTDGKTLYLRDRHRYGVGGHNTADSKPIPALGRIMGTFTCDAECAKTWPPVLASDGDQPSGNWTIVQRMDGAKQWAYQGYPLYAYTGDSKPGDATGNDLFTLIDGANALYWRTARP